MATSSSIRPAVPTGSVSTSRYGAVAGWWRVQRGELAKDALIGFVVGVVLFLGACWWDARLQTRQDALASAIADRQDRLARDLANQAEVLENTRFVRQLATSKGEVLKPFASINLWGAELGGLDLSCTDLSRHLGCADFTKADVREANLTLTDLVGADFSEADLQQATLDLADFSGAILGFANLNGVTTKDGPSADFHGAHLGRATLVQARLEHARFRDAGFDSVNADQAVLSWADFQHANLRRTRFKHAELSHAKFRGANMTHVDLTSADLRGANFTRADLRGADFTGADLRKAVLTDVCFDQRTKWGSNSPPASSSC